MRGGARTTPPQGLVRRRVEKAGDHEDRLGDLWAGRLRSPQVPGRRGGADAASPLVGLALEGERMAGLDWARIEVDLDGHGCATVSALLSPMECVALAETYTSDTAFRSRVVMARHGFGRGEYKYIANLLPGTVSSLRTTLYPPLSRIANRWNETLGIEVRYPEEHGAFLARCHEAGQTRPTPLLLRYEEGDDNCLHQDI